MRKVREVVWLAVCVVFALIVLAYLLGAIFGEPSEENPMGRTPPTVSPPS